MAVADGPTETVFYAKDSGLVTGKPNPLKYEEVPGLLTKEQGPPIPLMTSELAASIDLHDRNGFRIGPGSWFGIGPRLRVRIDSGV